MQPIFARITKVDEETRTVTGRAAQEVVDRDNEIFDYISSKPEFMRWSAEVSADTAGKSLGNVRSMHGNIAAGKLTSIDFNDVEKAIDVSAKIIDDNEWDKVMEGVHTGFSIGGRYARKWAEPINGKMVQRYTAVPTEISIVDRPCCPTAKFFSIHKTDGSVIQKFFKNQIELDTDGKIMFKGGAGSGPSGGGHTAEEARGKAADHAKMERLHTQASQKSSSAELSSAHAKAAEAHGKASSAYSEASEHIGAGLTSGQEHFSDAQKLGAKAEAKTAPLRTTKG